MPLPGARHLGRELLQPRVEGGLVPALVHGQLGHRHGASGFGLEAIALDRHFGGRKQRPRRAVALPGFGDLHGHGLHHVGHGYRMNLVARLQRLLLQVEEDLGEARPLLGEGEHRLVHDLHSQRRLHAFAACIGHAETHARILAGLVSGSIALRLDLQFVGGLHEDQPVIAHRAGIAAEQIGA